MADMVSEIVLDGGGPWGFRLQGGKDFGIPLNVSRVTPGSKAALKQMVVGDIICEINGVNTESLSHMEAQNHIKNAGSTLNMKIRKGKGISVGDQNAMSLGSAGSPKVLTETNVIHSASVDHTFNPKPKPFNFGTNSPTVTQGVSPQKSSPAPSAQAPKFDPGAYARKKKEELEQRKKAESTVAEDSDILKMINATSISKSPSPTSHSQTEEGSDPGAFRMVYSGRDIHEEVSPGSKSVISSLKDRVSKENSGLNSESKVPSRVFQMLQKQLDEEQAEDLPPPPPELIEEEEEPARPTFGSGGPGVQSRTFKMLQDSIGSDQAHQSVFSRPQEERNKAVPVPTKFTPSVPQQTTVNPIPKAPMPSGQNFKVSAPRAPSYHSSGQSAYKSPGPTAPSGVPATFKPSNTPQPFNAPQTTTSKVSSQKPISDDPSRTPVCQHCNQEIRGPFVSAIGKTWHPEHFACNSCKSSLQNQGFVEEQNKLFCEHCYNNFFAPKCAACGNSIIGVGTVKTRLCSHCMNVRATATELQPSSLQKLIADLKSDIVVFNEKEKRFKEDREIVLKRLKMAKWKQADVKQKILTKEEKRDRLEVRLKAAEDRVRKLLSDFDKSNELRTRYSRSTEEVGERLAAFEVKLEQAKVTGQDLWKSLSEKLAQRSQLYYHYQFIQSNAEKKKGTVESLEEQLGILMEKRELFYSREAFDYGKALRKKAWIEQYEDDIKQCRERISFANQQFLTLALYKESLQAEIESFRESKRDMRNQLASAVNAKENRSLHASCHTQYYR